MLALAIVAMAWGCPDRPVWPFPAATVKIAYNSSSTGILRVKLDGSGNELVKGGGVGTRMVVRRHEDSPASTARGSGAWRPTGPARPSSATRAPRAPLQMEARGRGRRTATRPPHQGDHGHDARSAAATRRHRRDAAPARGRRQPATPGPRTACRSLWWARSLRPCWLMNANGTGLLGIGRLGLDPPSWSRTARRWYSTASGGIWTMRGREHQVQLTGALALATSSTGTRHGRPDGLQIAFRGWTPRRLGTAASST